MTIPLDNINRLVPGLSGQTGRYPATENAPATAAGVNGRFADLFADLINSVNELHAQSAQIQDALLAGEPVELHEVMIRAEEAGLATDLLLEIRNRVVNAYNELLRMPV
ncbi:MAG TPA: flagellar hook-basal body complex protein FliE [Candidatus Deferrimicrobium sp.]|nr:flagellar hook-basal body complex protein FliE [Candidatus Deferrimicrobium sp.]